MNINIACKLYKAAAIILSSLKLIIYVRETYNSKTVNPELTYAIIYRNS